MTTARASGRLLYQIDLDVPPDEVWHAITDPEWTRRFFHDTAVHTTWRVGAPISYDLPDGTPAIAGRVVEYSPPRRFVMTARFLFDDRATAEPGMPVDGDGVVRVGLWAWWRGMMRGKTSAGDHQDRESAEEEPGTGPVKTEVIKETPANLEVEIADTLFERFVGGIVAQPIFFFGQRA